jgi:anti-sigma factor RsiW
MNMDAQFTDEQLTAYLDGEAADELCTMIDAALDVDEVLGERLADLDIGLDQISAAFDGLLAQAPAMPELSPPAPQAANLNRGIGWLGGFGVFGTGLAAGIAMMLFVGAGAAPEPKAPGWKAVVASYQSLYTATTIAGWTPTQEQTQTQLAAVSRLVGADLTSLPAIEGLTFKRAQILGFNGKPLVQIAFARADGTPVALCIIAANSTEAKAMQGETLGGMAAASWNVEGRAYLLIGGSAAQATQAEAAAFEAWAQTVVDI